MPAFDPSGRSEVHSDPGFCGFLKREGALTISPIARHLPSAGSRLDRYTGTASPTLSRAITTFVV